MKITSIVGARPQFIKLAPLIQAIKKFNKSNSSLGIKYSIIHTGQHYDYEMNKVFFDELSIPTPTYTLNIGSGLHGWQTGRMLEGIEKVLLEEKPDWALVFGDTNSTLAGSLAATKIHCPTAHVEAGLRSFNKKMPEETNRILTDLCSDILFCPTENDVRNLRKEGIKNYFNTGKLVDSSEIESLNFNHKSPLAINVGDIMMDVFLMSLKITENKSNILEQLKLTPKGYYLATIHRAENTNDRDILMSIMKGLAEVSKTNPVVFPAHPRTQKALKEINFDTNRIKSLRLIKPVKYFDFINLEKNARGIITDSGGMQKEAFWLKVPCFTIRNETEWPETIESKSNMLVESCPDKIVEKVTNSDEYFEFESAPVLGKGATASLIIKTLHQYIK